MKSPLIAFLLLTLALCLGLMIHQHQRLIDLEGRHIQSDSEWHQRYSEILPQALAYQKLLAVRTLADNARPTAKALASRHHSDPVIASTVRAK